MPNKIKKEDIKIYNEKVILKYLCKNTKGAGINEYFYINDQNIIIELLEKIKDKEEKDNSILLTNFFWNHKSDEYQIAENSAKFFLRLAEYKDNNSFIEVIDLTTEEKINYINNINNIVMSNIYLKKMFQIENETFIEKVIQLGKDSENITKITRLYCDDWIEKKEMQNLIIDGIKFIESMNLMALLSNKLPEKNRIKKVKL